MLQNSASWLIAYLSLKEETGKQIAGFVTNFPAFTIKTLFTSHYFLIFMPIIDRNLLGP